MLRIDIKKRVDDKGLNRNQLSKKLQIGYTATTNLYDGTTERIYFDTLERLCKVLDCTPNDILIFDKDDTE